MLHPLFPALTACFPASVRVALPIAKVSIAMPAPSAIKTDHFFVFRIFEMPVFFVLNRNSNKSAPGIIWQYWFPEAIYAAVRHGIISVTINGPVKSLKSHAM